MNHELLKYCLLKIEQKLNWASSELWLNQDFELLSERIFEETNVKLSITTLKRVWGKVNYASEPSISTLNALAKFINYENWSELKNSKTSLKPVDSPSRNYIPSKKYILTAAASVITILVILGISRNAFSEPGLDLEGVSFEAEPVTIGLPNSVVFKYDFGTNQVDSASIQQSWNTAFTFSIDPTGKEATGIYYYPGHFNAKLLANGKIIKEQRLLVGTEGWMATVYNVEVPRYLYYGELQRDGALHLTSDIVDELHQEEIERARTLTYHYFDELAPVSGKQFTLEARFRNTYNKSNGICQDVQVLIHGTETVYLTPFSIPGCTSNLNLITGGNSYSGKENDLSMFGIESSEWQDFKLVVSDQKAEYFLNDNLILTKEAPSDIGQIVGFKLRFEGAGELDYLRLSNDSGLVYNEEFESDLEN